MTNEEGEIRIYVACLAAYNNGILHGCWINAEQEADDINAAIREMLKASPIEGAEEWAIHDYEGFEGAHISEYEGIDQVAELAAFIAEHGELGGKLLAYFGDLETALNVFEHEFIGEYDATAGFVREFYEQNHGIPENLEFYIDWQSMAHDWEINDILALDSGRGSYLLFWSH